MFESVVEEPTPVLDDCTLDSVRNWLTGEELDTLDAAFDRMPADEDVPGEWAVGLPEHRGPGGGSDDDAPASTYGTCTPSGWPALELDVETVDTTQLSDTDLIESIIGFDRVASWAAARQARLIAKLARRRPADKAPNNARNACLGSEFVPDEIGVALHLSRGSASARIGLACRLLAVLPDTHALWEAGRIDTPKARAIDDATAVLDDTTAHAVEALVLPRAPEQTLAQLKAALARAVLAADPDGADDRHKEARKGRRVAVAEEGDGMASLWALLTATDAAGAYTWLTRLARGLGPDDPRTMDTRRADLLAALLNGRLVTNPDGQTDDIGADDTSTDDTSTDDTRAHTTQTTAEPGRPIHPVTPGKPLIQIVIAHSTLIGADDQPAELVGHGPIPAALARETAADDTVWRRIVTDPLSGTLLDYGRTTYHPPTGLADHVRVRDVYCRGPGCRRTAADADAELDHAVAWSDDGTTSTDNLNPFCLHHHLLKHHAGWTITTHPDGRLTWTTPTGHRHTTAPHDYDHRPEPPAPPPPPAPASPKPTDDEPDVDTPPF